MDPFVAEIRIFPFNFAPKGWAFCDGQILPLSQNTALFSLLGTTYGGDGKSNFALPNMQGNAAMHPGQGPGLSLHDLGEMSGSEFVTLLESEIPLHSHQMLASIDIPTVNTMQNNLTGQVAAKIYRGGGPGSPIAPQAVSTIGGSQPHTNFQPYLCINYIISLFGIFPSPT